MLSHLLFLNTRQALTVAVRIFKRPLLRPYYCPVSHLCQNIAFRSNLPVFSSHRRRRRSDDGGGFSFGSAQTQARCLTHFSSPGKGPRFPCNYCFSTFSNIFVMPSSPCHHLSGHTSLSIFPPRSSVRGFVKATKLRCDKISRQNLSPTGLPFASGGIVTNRSRATVLAQALPTEDP